MRGHDIVEYIQSPLELKFHVNQTKPTNEIIHSTFKKLQNNSQIDERKKDIDSCIISFSSSFTEERRSSYSLKQFFFFSIEKKKKKIAIHFVYIRIFRTYWTIPLFFLSKSYF